MKAFAALLACALCVSALGCGSNTVMIAMDDNFTQFRPMKKLNCNVHKDRVRSVSAGLKFRVAGGLGSVGPEVSFSRSYKANWNDTQQELVRRYEETCNAFNSGIISYPEYTRQMAKLDGYLGEMRQLAMQQREYMSRIAQVAFAELDNEVAKANARQFQVQRVNLETNVKTLNGRVRNTPAPRLRRGD